MKPYVLDEIAPFPSSECSVHHIHQCCSYQVWCKSFVRSICFDKSQHRFWLTFFSLFLSVTLCYLHESSHSPWMPEMSHVASWLSNLCIRTEFVFINAWLSSFFVKYIILFCAGVWTWVGFIVNLMPIKHWWKQFTVVNYHFRFPFL